MKEENTAQQAHSVTGLGAGFSSGIPDHFRCWIFGSSNPFDPAKIEHRMNVFISEWNSHGSMVNGQWFIYRNQFLIIVGDDAQNGGISGCGMDQIFHTVRLLENDMQCRLLDSGRLFFLREDDGGEKVNCVERGEFERLCKSGIIGPDTRVYDTMVERGAQLKTGFELPLKDSWHYKLWKRATA